jgi:hypothetical protein
MWFQNEKLLEVMIIMGAKQAVPFLNTDLNMFCPLKTNI